MMSALLFLRKSPPFKSLSMSQACVHTQTHTSCAPVLLPLALAGLLSRLVVRRSPQPPAKEPLLMDDMVLGLMRCCVLLRTSDVV